MSDRLSSQQVLGTRDHSGSPPSTRFSELYFVFIRALFPDRHGNLATDIRYYSNPHEVRENHYFLLAFNVPPELPILGMKSMPFEILVAGAADESFGRYPILIFRIKLFQFLLQFLHQSFPDRK